MITGTVTGVAAGDGEQPGLTDGWEQPGLTDGWGRLAAEPGLCVHCRYPKLTVTRRGTAYLRCTRASWDERLPKHPRLPVTECVGYDADV